ncbi:unnamed protein product [Amoebophrya sp. A25]|nr:unnamed protein product [Amoebophrya sp. A25]|eukprot:GSA25T00012880001.1
MTCPCCSTILSSYDLRFLLQDIGGCDCKCCTITCFYGIAHACMNYVLSFVASWKSKNPLALAKTMKLTKIERMVADRRPYCRCTAHD